MFDSSYRWKTTAALDVDAFLLTDRRWLLFAYLKEERLARAPDAEAYFRRLAAEFTRGEVLAVARALKTDKHSEPLAPIAVAEPGLSIADEVWAREGWLKYRLETGKVLNPGLFLDQSENRIVLQSLVQQFIERAKGQFGEDDGVLNLFSFTGSFSIAALGAGVRSTTSVDVSSRYLEWEKSNFESNFGGQEQLSHRLICDDSRDFLRRAAKKGTRYRWIIIDPPTFSRGKGKPFKVQDDLLPMLEEAVKCLSPGGALLASTNDARWEAKAYYALLEQFARAHSLKVVRGTASADFGPPHPLKSAWLLSNG